MIAAVRCRVRRQGGSCPDRACVVDVRRWILSGAEVVHSVVEILCHRALSHPKRAALIEGSRHLSYGELWRRVRAVAEEFTRRGMDIGDRGRLPRRTHRPLFVPIWPSNWSGRSPFRSTRIYQRRRATT